MADASPNTPCTAYTDAAPDVAKVRAFIAGGDGVREYIRKLRGHDDEDFTLYKSLAYYLPAVSRTLDAYTGMVMTPEPQVLDAADGFEPYLEDLTNDGEPFRRVTFRAVEEVAGAGRYCILVDYPVVEGSEELSKSDAEAMGLRAFARCYKREDIIDWRVTTRNGRRILSHLRLREVTQEAGASEWETRTKRRVRVLDLHKGRYRVRIFEATQTDTKTTDTDATSAGGKFEQVGKEIYPQRNGAHLTEIPAVVFSPNTLDPSHLEPPPLKEMCDVSQSHLNDSAHRQWAIMWCGNPTLVLAGLQATGDDEEPIRFGSSEAVILGEGGTAEIVALNGEGVGAIKDSMEEKRRDMAAIGARILADETSGNIAAETVRIQRAGEHSVLAGIANTVADGMTQVLRNIAEWEGIERDGQNVKRVSVKLNTDFLPKSLAPGELSVWLKGVQDGTMPLVVFLEHLKSRGAVSPEMTEQEWRDAAEQDALSPPAAEDGGQGNGDGGPPPPAN